MTNPGFMHVSCTASCGICEEEIQGVEELTELTKKFGTEQVLMGKEAHQTMEVIKQALEYMAKYDEEHEGHICQNKHELCSFWAGANECEANIKYMTTDCAPSCGLCSELMHSSETNDAETDKAETKDAETDKAETKDAETKDVETDKAETDKAETNEDEMAKAESDEAETENDETDEDEDEDEDEDSDDDDDEDETDKAETEAPGI